MKRTFLLFAFLILPVIVFGMPVKEDPVDGNEYYYVSVTGNDTNPGTVDLPFRTIQKAVDTAVNPGDTVYVRAGEYTETVRLTSWGAPDKPITLTGYRDERPFLNLNDEGPGIWQPVISVEASYINIRNLEIGNTTGRGIRVWRNDGVQTDVTISDVLIHHTVNAGIFAEYCDNLIIEDSRIWMTNRINNEDGPFYSSGRWSGGITARRADNIMIRGNEIFHSYGEGLNLHGGASNVVIKDNVFWDCHGPLLYPINSWNVRVEGNLVYHTNDPEFHRNGNPGSGIIIGNEKYFMQPEWYIRNYTVVNNMVMGCNVGFAFWFSRGFEGPSGLRDTLVAHNTFVDSHINRDTAINEGIWFQESDQHRNSYFVNNIILQNDESCNLGEGSTEGITFAFNSWSALPPENMTGDGDIYGDPGISRNGEFSPGKLSAEYFKLTYISPLIDAGYQVPQVVYDHFGSLRDSSPDIGACEVPGGPSPEPKPLTAPEPGDISEASAEETEMIAEPELTGIIKQVTPQDGRNWKIQADFRTDVSQYSDRPYKIDTIPEELAGYDWIKTSNDSKRYTEDPLAVVELTGPAWVYVAFNDNVDEKPEWISDWEDTGKDVVNDEPVTFSLHRKKFEPGTVELGNNGAPAPGMYTVIVVPADE
jgi:hypothetical protein